DAVGEEERDTQGHRGRGAVEEAQEAREQVLVREGGPDLPGEGKREREVEDREEDGGRREEGEEGRRPHEREPAAHLREKPRALRGDLTAGRPPATEERGDEAERGEEREAPDEEEILRVHRRDERGRPDAADDAAG